MDVAVVDTPPERVEADVLGLAVPEPVQLTGPAAELDRLLRGRLGRLVADGELTAEPGRVTLVHADDELPARRIAAVGVGPGASLDGDALRTAAAAVGVRAGEVGARTLAWALAGGDGLALSSAEQARAVVEGVALGCYDAGRWKTDGARPTGVERLVLCGPDAEAAAEPARRAAVVAAWTNRCRDLVNAPPNELTPADLADSARELAERFPAISFEALGPEEIRASGMGALTAVSQGSANPPRLVTLRYEPEGAPTEPMLGLVGKAITFDAGGISLKPADDMEEMKSDMGGGAAVLTGLATIAELGVPVRIVAVVPACENMPGGGAYRPGDIVRAVNGKTIEITNTDAEGRLILADALPHARAQGATHLLDLATLTGTIVVAMGDFYAGLFGNDAAWLEDVRAAGDESGDHVWPMPLHPSYFRHIESSFADVKNCPEKKRGSSIIAALFLQQFVGEGPWAHLDIAGTAFLARGRDYYPQIGATGYGVRLLAELAERVAARTPADAQ